MTQPIPAPARVCPNCDGFAQAAIDTGTRHPDGTRRTLQAHCHTCHGLGTITRPAAALAPAHR